MVERQVGFYGMFVTDNGGSFFLSGAPDPRWDERPLACVVRKSTSNVDAAALAAFLSEHVAKWQVPERWSFIDEVPKTSVGKFDKKVLRARHEKGELAVESLG